MDLSALRADAGSIAILKPTTHVSADCMVSSGSMPERDQRYFLEGIIEMDEVYLGAPKCGK
jgi:hypothetical protein